MRLQVALRAISSMVLPNHGLTRRRPVGRCLGVLVPEHADRIEPVEPVLGLPKQVLGFPQLRVALALPALDDVAPLRHVLCRCIALAHVHALCADELSVAPPRQTLGANCAAVRAVARSREGFVVRHGPARSGVGGAQGAPVPAGAFVPRVKEVMLLTSRSA